MDLNAARHLARSLMSQHGVGHLEFAFDNAVKRFGQTTYKAGGDAIKITLSKKLVMLNPESEVRQTILHEIAHALAGHAAGHGPKWERVARRLGHSGNRTHSAQTPALRYRGVCPNGHTAYRQRAPLAGRYYGCAKCSPTFNSRYVMQWTDTARVSVSA